jgi:hypothetical protein
MPGLVLALLTVSSLSLAAQVTALARVARSRAAGDAVSRGYLRTIACRVAAATAYVVVAAVQAAGDGSLSPEALAVFTAVQVLWVGNSLADIRIRRRLQGAAMPPDEARQLQRVAAITDELDGLLDRIAGTVSEVREILRVAAAAAAAEQTAREAGPCQAQQQEAAPSAGTPSPPRRRSRWRWRQ